MRKKPDEVAEGKLEKEVNAAIDRLLKGEPTNPELKAKAQLGKLRFSTLAVQKESGYSRTNFGHKKCRYLKLWLRIESILKPKPKGITQAEINAGLRHKVNNLSELLKIQVSLDSADIIQDYKDKIRARRNADELARKGKLLGTKPVREGNVTYLPARPGRPPDA